MINIGIDIGSTTVKLVLKRGDEYLYEKYQRHMSRAHEVCVELLREAEGIIKDEEVKIALTGSAGLGLAEKCDIPFVQEVYATAEVVRAVMSDVTTVIELGGEDAKVIFFDGRSIDERMNGTCAGGTGAFIDQMCVLLDMDSEEFDQASLKAERIYPIASRCGVFAKSDIQPLLNQGARKEDVAASIYHAVVSQTISGLIRGHKISGKVAFFGGPLFYNEGLRRDFIKTLELKEEDAIFPDYARFVVARGAALYSKNSPLMKYSELLDRLSTALTVKEKTFDSFKPLFESEEEFERFITRHKKNTVESIDISTYSGKAYLGIDCGSTTTKLVLLSENKEILYSYYDSNKGNPVDVVKGELIRIRELCKDRITIAGSAVTGYGEELIMNAFGVDKGLVETIAHYTAAKHFNPDVSFILDIGGQDIKCFKIVNGAIDTIMLNEACSSGCGSFIETFAKSMNYSVADFANEGLKAKAPVSLGSRCTVFMNSSVKQAQKDGASVEDISAGLSMSVIKNALYKVIRITSFEELGSHVVVQGGTFLNNAILRAFEMETGLEVIRPSIAGLMGAFGAALSAMDVKETKLISDEKLQSFTHRSSQSICQGCANHCHLTINIFNDGRRYITGNQCQKIVGAKNIENLPSVYKDKRELFKKMTPKEGRRGKIGLPLCLSMYELGPLWYGLFSSLGFEVVFTKFSTRKTYEMGQFSIASDTICYPAKIMHGHIMELLKDGVKNIFYPCLTMNVDEGASDNHYNCPVVAYYSEVLAGNVDELKDVNFMYPYLYVDNRKVLVKDLLPVLQKTDPTISKGELKKAVDDGFAYYENYKKEVISAGEKAIAFARENGKRIMILAGRPYHIDPEICHNIDTLANELGFVVVSEDSVAHLSPIQYVKVLDQWTFHARLYRAAHFAAVNKDVELVQLVSFGCGVDAITTDEVRDILESHGKHYTQLKIDEVNNLGAVKIRLRSLIGALEEEEKNAE